MMSNEPMSPETPLGQYAGFTTRMIAWCIDQLLLTITISVSVAVIGFLSQSFGINQLLGFGEGIQWLDVVLAAVLAICVPPLYNIACWMLAGQTVGKRIMGLRVVQTNGQGVKFWAAVRRQIGYVVSAILFLGFLWILFDDRRQGFHDKLAGTFVVYAWPEVGQPVRPIRDRVRAARIQRKMAQKQG